jgi:Lrp/AsnC family transcriptional regulator, leucine-responsive regulatory protein
VSSRAADPTDAKILALLTEDGRRSASEIGRRVGLSPAAAKRRIDNLERSGLIRGYTAILDEHKLEAFCELRFAPETQVDDSDQVAADVPELVESFTLAGEPDAIVRLRVRDVDHLKAVIDRIRRGGAGPTKITGTKTHIVLGARTGPAAR